MEYYDGTKLLSMKDINGNKPEIFMCTANNTAGKTTYFSRLLVNRFLDSGDKFMVVYRFSYELDECADKFYKDIGSLFFTGTTMTAKRRAELNKKRAQLLKTMLDKAGVTRSEIHDVAERRWVNANLDLLTPSEKKQYAEVLSL